ncbi:MAG: type II toxin-antitoxin system Rv0910 family toxin [Thermocrispum sp.]
MPKLSESAHVPAAPDEAWRTASDLSRLGEWLTMHDGWRGELPDELATGVELTSVVSVKGLRNRITWTISSFRPPESLTLTGSGVGGTKVSFELSISPDGSNPAGSRVTFDADFGGPLVIGPVGMTLKRAVRGEVRTSVRRLAALIG